MTVNTGESVRIMSGEHGTTIVGTGDEFPDWFTPAVTETADQVTETDDGESD